MFSDVLKLGSTLVRSPRPYRLVLKRSIPERPTMSAETGTMRRLKLCKKLPNTLRELNHEPSQAIVFLTFEWEPTAPNVHTRFSECRPLNAPPQYI